MIEYYLNHIKKQICAPNECMEQDYQNKKAVVHWHFDGDGTGEFEERADAAMPDVVRAYIHHCQDQAALGLQYLQEITEGK